MTSATKLPSVPGIAPDTPDAIRAVLEPIKEIVEVRAGQRGDPLDAAVTKRELIDTQLVLPGSGTSIVANPSAPVTGTGGGSGSGYDPTTDTTMPPAPTGVTTRGAIQTVMVSWNAPDPTVFKNYAYAQIWRASTNSFASATQVATERSFMYVDAGVTAGTTYYYWVKFVSEANVVGPYQGISGIAGGPTLVGGVDLGASIVQATNLASGAVTPVKFASGTSPVFIGAALPTLPNASYPAGSAFILTTNNKLYRSTGSTWTAATDGADIAAGTVAASSLVANTITAASGVIANGAIINAMIADAAITNAKIASLAVKFANIDTATITNLAALSATMGAVSIDGTAGGYHYVRTGSKWWGSGGVAGDGQTGFILAKDGSGNSFMRLDAGNNHIWMSSWDDSGISFVGAANFTVKSATSGARTEMGNRAIKIYDSAGTLRVRIGDLSA